MPKWLLILIAIGMFASSMVKLYLVFLDEGELLSVFLGQAWFGYAFYSLLAGKAIRFTGGGSFDADAGYLLRLLVGGTSLVIYVAMFFY